MDSPDAAGTLGRLAHEVGRALSTLDGVLAPQRTPSLFFELGLDSPPDLSADTGFAAALARAADAVPGLVAAVDALTDAADEGAVAQALADLLDRIRLLLLAVHGVADALRVATAGSPDAAQLADFAATFAERLLGAALVDHLDAEHPFLRRVLSLLTIVEMDTVLPPGSDVVPVTRRRFHPERAPRWISDPLGVLRDGYGWGADTFDGRTLFGNVADVSAWCLPLSPLAAPLGAAPPVWASYASLFG